MTNPVYIGYLLGGKFFIIAYRLRWRRSTLTGPFEAIHVGAAAPILPQALVDQLARPGRMFIPIGVYSQDIIQVDKAEDGSVTQKRLFAVQVGSFQKVISLIQTPMPSVLYSMSP